MNSFSAFRNALPQRLLPIGLALLLLPAALGPAGCGGGYHPLAVVAPAVPVTVIPPSIWAGAWGASISNANVDNDNKTTNSETSYRFQIRPTIGGTQERLRFSNYFGTAPVTLGAVRLSVGTDGTAVIDPTHDAPVTFNAGQTSVTLAPGQILFSDPILVTFTYGQVLDVSIYLKGTFGPVDRHDSIFVNSYSTPTGTGDKTTDSAGTSFTHAFTDWHLVSEMDVYGKYQGTVAVFGSSTTDGTHSDFSSDKVYPAQNSAVAGQDNARLSDQLAKRFNAAGYQVGIVNEGIGGDTVTVDIQDKNLNIQNANDRIQRDVLALPSLLAVLTYFGSIDIRSPDCMSAPAIESATTQMIGTAHAAGVPLFLSTIPPSAFCTNPAESNYGPYPMYPYTSNPFAGGATPGPQNGGETQRIAFNAWARSTAVNLPGVAGILDYDKALADPANPNFLLPPYNSGDNYHPTGAGYAAEAAVVPLHSVVPNGP